VWGWDWWLLRGLVWLVGFLGLVDLVWGVVGCDGLVSVFDFVGSVLCWVFG